MIKKAVRLIRAVKNIAVTMRYITTAVIITAVQTAVEKEMEETGRPRGGTNTAYSEQKKLFTKIGQNFFGFSLFLEWNML